MNKREKGLLSPTDVKMTIAQLDKLPLRIVQELAQSKCRDKNQLTADFGFVLDSLEIELIPHTSDRYLINVMYMGRIIGHIITKRGHQFYAVINEDDLHVTSKEWKHFLRLMVDKKEEIRLQDESVQERAINIIEKYLAKADEPTEQELSDVQDDYEASTDQSLSPDERDFIREFGELADNILSQVGRTDQLVLIKDDRNQYRVCDTESDFKPVIWTNPDTRLWGTNVYQWGKLTPNPLEHLTDYVNNISK